MRAAAAGLVSILVALVLQVSSPARADDASSSLHADLERLAKIEARHRAELFRLPGVVGVGVGLSSQDERRGVIIVNVTAATPELRAQITSKLEGAPVEIVEGSTPPAPL